MTQELLPTRAFAMDTRTGQPTRRGYEFLDKLLQHPFARDLTAGEARTTLELAATDDVTFNRVNVSSTTPILQFYETDASSDEGRWNAAVSGGLFVLQTLDDDDVFGQNGLLVRRTGTNFDSWEFRTSNGVRALWDDTVVRFPSAYSATTASAANVQVASNGQLQRSTSRRDSKQDIQPLSLEAAYKIVGEAEPVSFEPKGGGRTHYGFIADDIAAIDPVLGTYGGDGRIEAYEPPALIAALMAVVRDLTVRVAELEK